MSRNETKLNMAQFAYERTYLDVEAQLNEDGAVTHKATIKEMNDEMRDMLFGQPREEIPFL